MLNRKSLMMWIIGALIIAASLCTTFYLGAQAGSELSRNGMAPFRAYLAYSDVARIKKGKVEDFLDVKETDIDNEIYFWGKYLKNEEPLGDLLFPEHAYDREKFIRAVVKYRLENPHNNVADIKKYGEGADKESYASERQQVIDSVLSRYANQSGGNGPQKGP